MESSEIALLIRQSIDQDRMRVQQQEFFQQVHGTGYRLEFKSVDKCLLCQLQRSPGYRGASSGKATSEEEDEESSTATPVADDSKSSEDATPEPMAEDQPQIEQLLTQLRKVGTGHMGHST